jgi:hypothetical protein
MRSLLAAEVRFESVEGRWLTLDSPSEPDRDDIWSFDAALHVTDNVRATTRIHDLGASLVDFFQGLNDQSPFQGHSYRSVDSRLKATSKHDQLGSIHCLVILRQPDPPSWSATAELTLGAGAQLEALIADLRQFCPFQN